MELMDARSGDEGPEYLELQRQGRDLTRRITAAYHRGDDATVDALLGEKDKVNKRMKELNGRA